MVTNGNKSHKNGVLGLFFGVFGWNGLSQVGSDVLTCGTVEYSCGVHRVAQVASNVLRCASKVLQRNIAALENVRIFVLKHDTHEHK